MGWITDLLKDVPVTAVVKERLALAEDKYKTVADEKNRLQERIAVLEEENASLRAQLPKKKDGALEDDTKRVLVQLFTATDIEDRGVRSISNALRIANGVAKYHLDRLEDANLALCTSADDIDVYWNITPEGRRYAVENKLV